MSTKFTRPAINSDDPAPITVLMQTASQWFLQAVLERLANAGFDQIRESHLILLGNLDCGTTHASAVAQRIGVSRQAVARMLRDMEQSGFIRLEPDTERRNQNLVVMTDRGGALALAARAALENSEKVLAERIGAKRVAGLRDALAADWGKIP